jgi:hypothetical protein
LQVDLDELVEDVLAVLLLATMVTEGDARGTSLAAKEFVLSNRAEQMAKSGGIIIIVIIGSEGKSHGKNSFTPSRVCGDWKRAHHISVWNLIKLKFTVGTTSLFVLRRSVTL